MQLADIFSKNMFLEDKTKNQHNAVPTSGVPLYRVPFLYRVPPLYRMPSQYPVPPRCRVAPLYQILPHIGSLHYFYRKMEIHKSLLILFFLAQKMCKTEAKLPLHKCRSQGSTLRRVLNCLFIRRSAGDSLIKRTAERIL